MHETRATINFMIDLQVNYIFSKHNTNFELACDELINQLKTLNKLIKLSFFIDAKSNNDFALKKDILKKAIIKLFGTSAPGLTFISQKPLNHILAAECVCYNAAPLTLQHKKSEHCNYLIASENDDKKILFITNLEGDTSESISTQCTSLFKEVEEIFSKEKFDLHTIVRQWNYIPGITLFENNIQNYQAFNDARTLHYNHTAWPNGYPAATGIGTQFGGVHIDLMAIQGYPNVHPIINKQQVDAHNYSEDVLEGYSTNLLTDKSTPKFERAKLINESHTSTLFISGTAAIKGEVNYHKNDSALQTELTLDHIEELIYSASQLEEKEPTTIKAMRVYIKLERDYKVIKDVCKQRYPDTPVIYLLSDVCRDELLVEIEGIAQ